MPAGVFLFMYRVSLAYCGTGYPPSAKTRQAGTFICYNGLCLDTRYIGGSIGKSVCHHCFCTGSVSQRETDPVRGCPEIASAWGAVVSPPGVSVLGQTFQGSQRESLGSPRL